MDVYRRLAQSRDPKSSAARCRRLDGDGLKLHDDRQSRRQGLARRHGRNLLHGQLPLPLHCAKGGDHAKQIVALLEPRARRGPRDRQDGNPAQLSTARPASRWRKGSRCDMQPLVGVIMGSKSDWETMRHAAEMLDAVSACRTSAEVVSAHRTPAWMAEYAAGAESRGIEVIIAGAGGAAHLPGMVAANTLLPVLGVPVESHALKGMDSLLSIVQMPGGIPVGTLAIGKAGRAERRAAGGGDSGESRPELREKLRVFRDEQADESPLGRAAVTSRFCPGAAIGVLGSGQLGRMFAIAARRMGYRVHTLSPGSGHAHRPGGRCGDQRAVRRSGCRVASFARHVSVVTFEFENVPAATAEAAGRYAPVRPSGSILHTTQQRIREKAFLASAGLPHHARIAKFGHCEGSGSRARRSWAARRC